MRTRGTQTPEASVRRVQAETERQEKMEQEALGGGSDGVKGRLRNDEREKEEEEEANDTCNTPREVREAMKWFNTWGKCGRQVTMEYYDRLPDRWQRRVSSCAVSDWPGARRPSAAERGRWETEPFMWRDDGDLGEIRIRIAVCPLTRGHRGKDTQRNIRCVRGWTCRCVQILERKIATRGESGKVSLGFLWRRQRSKARDKDVQTSESSELVESISRG